MTTQLISLPTVAGGIGAGKITSALAAKKTILATGLSGRVNIEASNDGGLTWCQIASFAGSTTDQVQNVVAELMRVNAEEGSADDVQVIAERASISVGIIPAPPSDGEGASLDVSTFGCLSTVIVGNFAGRGSINIEISGDGVEWSTGYSFKANGCQHKSISARFIRAVGNGATGDISVASEDPGSAANSEPITSYVFRPEATGDDAPGGNVYTDWEELYAALQSTKHQGPRELYFDSRFSTQVTALGPEFPACVIPEGTWDMLDVTWKSFGKSGPETGLSTLTVVTFEDFAYCPRLEDIHFHGVILHDGELHSPLSSPFTAGLTGSCELANTNPLAKPLCSLPIDTTGRPIVFNFMDGCQFGASVGPTPTVFNTPPLSIAPLIDAGDNFVFMVGLGCILTDKAFKAGPFGFIGFLGANSGFSGTHSWQQPDCPNGFFAFTLTSGGVWSDDYYAGADGDLWANRRYKADTREGAINLQMFDANAPGMPVTIYDGYGSCGLANVEVLAPPSFGAIEEPYLNRPYQSKTWISDNAGNWILDKNAYEEFVTNPIADWGGPVAVAAPGFVVTDGVVEMTGSPAAPFNDSLIGQEVVIAGSTTNDGTFVIIATTPTTLSWAVTGGLTESQAGTYAIAQVATNNATNVVDSDPGTFALTLPLAASAKKGAIIRVVNIGVAQTPGGVVVTPEVGDTVLGTVALTDGLFGSWQSDGATTWIQIA